jgi:hypothetical protein
MSLNLTSSGKRSISTVGLLTGDDETPDAAGGFGDEDWMQVFSCRDAPTAGRLLPALNE